MTVNGRVLQCTGCRQWVRVYEACAGARSDVGHEWIDPAQYECGQCLEQREAVPGVVEQGLAAAIGKAMHAQNEAA